MKGKCNICGCTEGNACYHPDFGACCWVNDEQDLCSHCVELKDVPGVERPADRGEVELDNLSDKAKIMAGHPFNYMFFGVEEKLKINEDRIVYMDNFSRGMLAIHISGISRIGIHWYAFVLDCKAKGFISFKDCKVLES